MRFFGDIVSKFCKFLFFSLFSLYFIPDDLAIVQVDKFPSHLDETIELFLLTSFINRRKL